VRYGLIGSIVLHILVFGFVIFNFTFSGKDDAPPPTPVSVEVMSPKDFSERQAGKIDGRAEKPAPPAEVKAPDATANAKKEAEQKASPKPAEKEALAPPPPPKAEPPALKPVEHAKVEPPKPVVKKEPPKPKKVEEVKRPDAPAIKPVETKHTPERPFDPNRIESLLKKDAEREPRPQTSQSTMETQPSRQFAERQAAVINRDPNAGQVGGDWDRSRPWRPASSLEAQAMGIPQARGAMNAGTCADLVQSRIEQNWDLPIGALSAETTIVRLRIELNRDGTLLRQPTVMDSSMSPTYQAMADAAVRAALRGQPYIIPPEQYERCRDMVLRFNPRDMYGG
jgi:outer membrane biosynthesis protein TonB